MNRETLNVKEKLREKFRSNKVNLIVDKIRFFLWIKQYVIGNFGHGLNQHKLPKIIGDRYRFQGSDKDVRTYLDNTSSHF